ncbi:MAG: magnesium chelatase [Actinobacteria bacterium HGW-Actinobacteria-5]|mgnify:CR=1 FL=1|jgi:Ca-activated chloride channel family protein|nr:MAG: magnesium chelatase [Actinobacteria bacterium HGW-Actinobacteria-5]
MPLDFMRPERLWWLLMIPLLVGLYLFLLWRRRRRARPHAITNLDRVLPKQQSWKRHLAVSLAVLALAALNVAFAQPKGEVEVPRERATIVLTIDVSRSMIAEDVAPNRLAAAKAAAQDFLQMLPAGFNVALVSFAGTAAVVVPPTTDRGVVAAAIENLQVAPSTAIGEGIYSSLDAMAQAPPDPNDPDSTAPGAIVLLSDGYTNVGRPSDQAAQESKKRGIPIYTIAYGTANGYVENEGRREPVPVNPAELNQISRISGGKAFAAGSESELKQVYSSIARQVGYMKVDQEVTEAYAGYALGFAILAGIAVISLAARWP